MNSAERDAVAVWKRLEKIPDLKQASLSPRGNFIQIESSWSVTDPAKLDASSLSKTWLFDTKSACVIPLQSRTQASPTTVVKKTTTTKSGLFAQIVEIEVGKNKELFIERWDQDRRLNRIPLAKTVESVPKDADLTGGAVLSDDGRHCVFAGELKDKTKKSFFDDVPEKTETKDEKTDAKDDTTYGDKFSSKPSWGEQMTKTFSPGIVLVDFETEILQKVQKEGYSYGDPQINSDGDIIYLSIPEKPHKLGKVFCTNRPMTVVYTTIDGFEDTDKQREISESCRSPRFIPKTRKFVYLKREAYGPHMDCDSIELFDLASGNTTELVATVKSYPHDEETFAGIYCTALSKNPFITVNGEAILLVSSVAKNSVSTFAISLGGKIVRIKFDGSCRLLATSEDMALVSQSSHVSSSSIQLVWFTMPAHKTISYKTHQISAPQETFEYELKNFELESKAGCPFQSHVLSKPGNTSVMLRPHGGPNSCVAVGFCKTYIALLDLGYDIIFPNYVGSIGFGQDQVHALGGHIGDYDVADCLTALDAVLATKKYESIYVCGGSHGGFLTAHLTAARPNQFCAAAIANGVINLNSMRSVTDIPDWCDYQTFGHKEQYKYGSVLADKQLAQMLNASPISKVDNVKCPTIVFIGWKDLRVPPPQGVEWVRALQNNRVACRQMDYPEDCHSIDKTESNADEFVHTHSWFNKYKSANINQ